MPNATVANYSTPASNNHFNGIWKLTRALKKAGWTYKASGDATAKDVTGTASNDKWGGNADPLADTIPTLGTGSWWCAKGASILKLPITAAVTGSFVKGENVIQATTLAEGEILGAVFDSGSNTGWVVIAPRVDGSGADPRGWNHVNAVTGALSGASFTPSATVIEFVTEVVFWKSADLLTGSWYFQCVDQAGEAASRFSALAASAGCTAAIAPGGGGTANGFPAVGSWVPLGTGGSAAHFNWIGSTQATAVVIGKVQIMVANCTPAANVSADGSFICAFGNPGTSAGSHTGFALQRVDDQEEGDVCPFVTANNSTTTQVAAVYSASGAVPSTTTDFWYCSAWGRNTNTVPANAILRSWRRRGMSSGDAFVVVEPASLASWYNSGGASSFPILLQNTGDPEKVAAEAVVSYVAEPIWIFCGVSTTKVRKGSLRWIFLVSAGNGCDTWRNKTLMQLVGSAGQAFIGGPWDGSSTPSNS